MNPVNPDTVLQFFQQSFRVAIGTGNTLAETLQSPQTGLETWNKLTTNPTQLAQELAEKGLHTEQEARAFVDRILEQQQNPSASGVTVTTTATPIAPDLQMELQDLASQLSAIRTELAQLREQRQG
jgi:polyhydroxyalkanoate synthesis regulator phasin